MISAFGVEHTEVSKALKPHQISALQRTALDNDLLRWRHSMYATDRLSLHNIKDLNAKSAYRGPLPLASKYRKKGMARLTRTRRGDRDANRKPIFGESTKA